LGSGGKDLILDVVPLLDGRFCGAASGTDRFDDRSASFDPLVPEVLGNDGIIARPAKGEFGRISRMLELGAHGIMYPRCESAAEAKQVVNAAKFAPIGKRGFDGSNPDAEFCLTPMADYVRIANENTFVLIQIEDPEAVDRAEEIAAVDGVDAIMLGPGDLSVLSGIPGQLDHPTIVKAFEKIAQAAKNAGKNWASITLSLDHARQLRDMGAMLLFHSADIIMVKQGLERIQREFATLGFKPRTVR